MAPLIRMCAKFWIGMSESLQNASAPILLVLKKRMNEKSEHPSEGVNILNSLPMRQRELLRILADQDGRTEMRELLWLIEARAAGKLKDIGDAEADPIVPRDLQPQNLGRTQESFFERTHARSDATSHSHPPPTSPPHSIDH